MCTSPRRQECRRGPDRRPADDVIDSKTDEPVWTLFTEGVRPIAFEMNPDGSTKRAFVQCRRSTVSPWSISSSGRKSAASPCRRFRPTSRKGAVQRLAVARDRRRAGRQEAGVPVVRTTPSTPTPCPISSCSVACRRGPLGLGHLHARQQAGLRGGREPGRGLGY